MNLCRLCISFRRSSSSNCSADHFKRFLLSPVLLVRAFIGRTLISARREVLSCPFQPCLWTGYRDSDRVLCFGLNGAGSRHWTRSTRLLLRAKRLWLKLGKWEHRFWRWLPPLQELHRGTAQSYESYDLQPYYAPLPKGSTIHSAIPSFE